MELRSEQSKKYLAEALLDLMRKKAFSEIKIQEIVKRAGLSHMAYYRNFSCKEEILIYYLDAITDDFMARSSIRQYNNDFGLFIKILFVHLISVKEIALLLYKNRLIHYVKEEFDRIMIQSAVTTEEKYRAYFISGGLYNIYYFWLINHCRESADELAEYFMNFSYPHYP